MSVEEDEGLAADLPHLTRRRVVSGLALGGMAWAMVPGAVGAEGHCTALPAESAGPFPADGTNRAAGRTVNILTEAEVLRQDIRNSIGRLEPVADGVSMEVEITLVDVGQGCAPLAGRAFYLWQCDAEGVYSIYEAADRNYLRGLALSDRAGVVRFTTVVPGCYPGRWPHFHFQVFADADSAVSGRAAILTSQFALPEGPCRAVYGADLRYRRSTRALDRITLGRDVIFRGSTEAELQAQMLTMRGSPQRGYRATGTVGLL